MKSIIEQIYYGELSPCSLPTPTCEKYIKVPGLQRSSRRIHGRNTRYRFVRGISGLYNRYQTRSRANDRDT